MSNRCTFELNSVGVLLALNKSRATVKQAQEIKEGIHKKHEGDLQLIYTSPVPVGEWLSPIHAVSDISETASCPLGIAHG